MYAVGRCRTQCTTLWRIHVMQKVTVRQSCLRASAWLASQKKAVLIAVAVDDFSDPKGDPTYLAVWFMKADAWRIACSISGKTKMIYRWEKGTPSVVSYYQGYIVT